jgi:tripartite-type tricarboxylate transporter receptor subunit TctC
MTRNRRQVLQLAPAVVAIATARSAFADTYPARPITLIVPTPAGAVTDTTARIMADRMRGSLGQPLVVEDVPGGGFILGNARVSHAAPDGYTIGIGQWSSHVSSPAILSTPYDIRTDFEPISLLPSSLLWIVARPSFPANDLRDLIAWLKANPDKATAGLPGVGSGGHVSAIYFQNATGTRFQLVPYRGGAPAVQDLMAGHVDLMFAEASQMLPHVRSGNIKPYAVMADHRWAAAPDVPTVDEMGVPGLYISFWHGLWAPKDTPKEIIAKLNAAVVDTLADPPARQRFADLGQEIPPPERQTPEALRTFHKAEIEKWWPIIKAANIKFE